MKYATGRESRLVHLHLIKRRMPCFFFSAKLTPTRTLDGDGVSTVKERHKTCAEKGRAGLCCACKCINEFPSLREGVEGGGGCKGGMGRCHVNR